MNDIEERNAGAKAIFQEKQRIDKLNNPPVYSGRLLMIYFVACCVAVAMIAFGLLPPPEPTP